MNRFLAPSHTSASGKLDVTGWPKIQEFWVACAHFDAGRLPANMPSFRLERQSSPQSLGHRPGPRDTSPRGERRAAIEDFGQGANAVGMNLFPERLKEAQGSLPISVDPEVGKGAASITLSPVPAPSMQQPEKRRRKLFRL
jgi:hypothetical protein